MSGADDLLNAVQKVFGDKPLVLLAGASDLVNEKLRELPEALSGLQTDYKEFPMRAAGALIGQAFRANLKVGALYDDLTRRGEDVVAKMRGEIVYAEEDEPFVREPFMPEPVHPAPAAVPSSAKKPPRPKAAPAKKTAVKSAAQKTAAQKTPAKKAGVKKAGVKQAEPPQGPQRKTPARKAPVVRAPGQPGGGERRRPATPA